VLLWLAVLLLLVLVVLPQELLLRFVLVWVLLEVLEVLVLVLAPHRVLTAAAAAAAAQQHAGCAVSAHCPPCHHPPHPLSQLSGQPLLGPPA
jgi:hypothetical protein